MTSSSAPSSRQLSAPDAELVVAEAEDHLRELASRRGSADTNSSTWERGTRAISAFGSVRAVRPRAQPGHQPGRRGPRDRGPEAGLPISRFAIAACRFVALGHGQRFGRNFHQRLGYRNDKVHGRAMRVLAQALDRSHTCAQAAMLDRRRRGAAAHAQQQHRRDDALGAFLLALMYWRRGGVLVLPSGFFPLVAAAVFAVSEDSRSWCARSPAGRSAPRPGLAPS